MSVAIIDRPQTKANTHSGISFSCDVKLSDSQQIIIDVPEVEWDYTINKYKKTGVIKKYRLEEIQYGIKWGDDNREQVILDGIKVRGFRKDGGLRFRDETLYYLTDELLKEVMAQIPDDYHNYAREEFAKTMADLQQLLTAITNNGVKIV